MSYSTSTIPNMPSWRALTTSRLASLKDYVAQMDYRTAYSALSLRLWGEGRERQTGDKWERQEQQQEHRGPDSPSESLQPMSPRVEKVQLFPGWAVRRYADPTKANQAGVEFSLSVYVSGFATSVRSPEAATRSQKAFYRIARGYAALPKLSASVISEQLIQRSATPLDLGVSNLCPGPSEITRETEFAVLESHLKEMSSSVSHGSQEETDDQNTRPRASVASTRADPSLSESVQPVYCALQKLHDNLDARLQPFWSSSIPNRPVKLSIFCPRTNHEPFGAQGSVHEQETDLELVATQDLITDNQGSFQTTFLIPWKTLLTYQSTRHIAFGDPDTNYPVVVLAEMPPSSCTISYSPSQYRGTDYSRSQPCKLAANTTSSLSPQSNPQDSQLPSINSHVTVPLSKFHAPIRLISDIDDTIKHTGVPFGAKNVFQNVFVRQLDELIVHGMVEWYQMLSQRGVSFHYVSNSPIELLSVLDEFFRISSFPRGSIKLKSYAARSLLPAMLSPPASRKRQGVVEVLDAFPESRFILVGDSGEQDMELYTDLARERPDQIVGVFIRNVTTRDQGRWSVDRPEETSVSNENIHVPLPRGEPGTLFMPSVSPAEVFAPALDGTRLSPAVYRSNIASPPYIRSFTFPTAIVSRLPGLPPWKSAGSMAPEERRHYELCRRIDRAREDIPQHIAFRVFQEPDECIEVKAILDTWLGSTLK